MLDLVNCKVLSVIESEHVDAYLLSESSMFVFPHKVVLKTCGTTTLLYGLPRLLEIAALDAGFPHVVAQPTRGIAAAATPYRVFYSRKNFLYPEQQRGPHRSWRDEVKFLDQRFQGGSAYMIGKMNGEHWYLYITGPDTRLTPPPSPGVQTPPRETETKFLNLPPQRLLPEHPTDEDEDETLEILMTDLDEQNARQFYLEDASAVAEGRFLKRAREAKKEAIQALGSIPEEKERAESLSGTTANENERSEAEFDVFEQTSSDHSNFSAEEGSEGGDLTFPEELTTEGHTLGTIVSETCGLADVYPTSKYPDASIDAYLFTPCGFSANGVVPAPYGEGKGKDATHYFTVHVTPEPQCSYASFETNVPARQTGRETSEVVEHVVGIFKPGRFSVTIFEAKPKDGGLGEGRDGNAARRSQRMECIRGYRRVDRIVHDLEGYDLVFRYYEREGWEGGMPRLGEVDMGF